MEFSNVVGGGCSCSVEFAVADDEAVGFVAFLYPCFSGFVAVLVGADLGDGFCSVGAGGEA